MTLSLLNRAGALLCLLLCLLLVAPAVIDSKPASLGWDDAHYLHRMACVTHALTEPGSIRLGDCLSLVVKAPLMAWLGLPWGEQAATAAGLGLASVSLALLTLGAFLWLSETLIRAGVPWPAVALACAAAGTNSLAASIAGGFLGDTLSAVLITLMLLLPLWELLPLRPDEPTASSRGILWGVIMAGAVMAKTSAGFFALSMAPLLLGLRVRRHGWADAARAAGAMIAVTSPVILYHLVYWTEIIGHALASARGPLAAHYSYGLDATGYLVTLWRRCGWPATLLTLLAGVVSLVLAVQYREPGRRRWVLLWPLFVLVVYLGLAAFSDNHDMRYGLPVAMGLPFLLTALAAGAGEAPGWVYDQSAIRFWAALWTALVLSVPMAARHDLRFVREAQAALATLPSEQPLSVLLASDDSAINLETLLLAQQLDLRRFGQMAIDTLVYDEVNGQSPKAILGRLDTVDAVLLLSQTPIRKAPDWTNRFAAPVRERLRILGAIRQTGGSSFLEVYRLKPSH
ncbi:MAG: hypothetical protein WCP34_06705 [Pseudomonadota bacterium]